ncbi:hypothetical protein OSH04_00510 [Alcaligenes sp. A-TC2]|uniref:hypothetical protein n=1 Tax=Alcaligenes nematophilus TaxID=2994643 RepID=UPI00224D0837|nr:hypothetical protein [Alcaligenes nematophilus]MCX5470186.1 hypothetical protein [Alcaligenes nematophilus]
MSFNKEADQVQELVKALAEIQKPLRIFAILKLTDEFYTKEEREKLLAKYESLIEADQAACEVLQAAKPQDGLGYEERVAKYGEQKAKDLFEPVADALNSRKETMRRVGEFESEHPLITQLFGVRGGFRSYS